MFLLLALFIVFLLLYLNKRALVHQRELNRLQIIRQKELLDASFQVQEQERKRIGQDIHDDIGPGLSTVKYALTGFRHTESGEDVEKQIEDISDQLSNLIQQVRRVSRDLTPTRLHKYGLLIAIEEFLERFRDSGIIQPHFQVSGTEVDLPEKTELALYRIIQELCTNSIRHAAAKILEVKLHFGTEVLELEVRDDGKGMPETLESKGIGLKNIEARASLIDASWEINSSPGKGTLMAFRIPLRENGLSAT